MWLRWGIILGAGAVGVRAANRSNTRPDILDEDVEDASNADVGLSPDLGSGNRDPHPFDTLVHLLAQGFHKIEGGANRVGGVFNRSKRKKKPASEYYDYDDAAWAEAENQRWGRFWGQNVTSDVTSSDYGERNGGGGAPHRHHVQHPKAEGEEDETTIREVILNKPGADASVMPSPNKRHRRAGSQSVSSSLDGLPGSVPASVSSLKPEEFAALLLAEQADPTDAWTRDIVSDDTGEDPAGKRTKAMPDIADAVAALCEKEERVKQEAAEIERLKAVLTSLEAKEQQLALQVEAAGKPEEAQEAEKPQEEKGPREENGDGLSPFDDQEVELWELRHEVGRLSDREAQLAIEVERLRGREQELQEQLPEPGEVEDLQEELAALRAQSESLAGEAQKVAALRRELAHAHAQEEELRERLDDPRVQGKGGKELLIELELVKRRLADYEQRERAIEHREEQMQKRVDAIKELEMELLSCRRQIKELSLSKRKMSMQVQELEGQVRKLANLQDTEEMLRKEEENAALRHAYDDMQAQVEGLQMNRFSEVEELVYLRWVNACLRFELRNYKGMSEALTLNASLSPRSQEKAKGLMMEYAYPQRSLTASENGDESEVSVSGSESEGVGGWGAALLDAGKKNKGFFAKLRERKVDTRKMSSLETLLGERKDEASEITTYGAKKEEEPVKEDTEVATPTKAKAGEAAERKADPTESLKLMSKSVANSSMSEKYPPFKVRSDMALSRQAATSTMAAAQRASRRGGAKSRLPPMEVVKRPTRVPRPPPRPTAGGPSPTPGQPKAKPMGPGGVPPPPPPPPGKGGPPPPPPPPGAPGGKLAPIHTKDGVQRAPEVIQLYQSLMRIGRGYSGDGGMASAGGVDVDGARGEMVAEIENRSSHLLAIKADVETQAEFVKSLAQEVRDAHYEKVEDVVAFVSWLDEELSFLVDERAVLKHFDWPEGKADALREASFEYQDLMKLQRELENVEDDARLPVEASLQKMFAVMEKVEPSIYALLRTRDMAIARYREFGVPVYWIQDSGVVGSIKKASVGLARKYMQRVARELDQYTTVDAAGEKEPIHDFLLLQGVRFAFRVHQFAGGFDADSMRAFEELRNRAHAKVERNANNNAEQSVAEDVAQTTDKGVVG